MLPTWAAILIALVGSALGAISGGLAAYLTLKSSQLSLRHQRDEAWRTRLIDGCSSFASAYLVAMTMLDEVIVPPAQAISPQEIRRAISDANDRGVAVSILFGQDAAIDAAGTEIIQACYRSLNAFEKGDLATAKREWKEAARCQREFIQQAHLMIAPH